MKIKKYLGQCDKLRCNLTNETYWILMMQYKKKISDKAFIKAVDMTSMLDEDETAIEYISNSRQSDSSSNAYKSKWGDKECVFFQTSGFEFIFV